MKVISLFLACILTACASTTDFELMRQEINGLKRDNYEIKKEVDSLKEKSALSVREDSFAAVRENQSELNSKLTEISKGLQELRGRFEESKYHFDKNIKENNSELRSLKSSMQALDTKVKKFTEPGIVSEKSTVLADSSSIRTETNVQTPENPITPDRLPAEVVKKAVPEVSKPEPLDKSEAYESAYSDFKNQKYSVAREKFTDFIKKYPKNELTDNAQFWIAETYYAEKDYEGSILAYENLLKKYPESEKTSGALLKQGLAFIEIGDKKTGQIILEKLIEKYPDSNEADVAKKKLGIAKKK